MLVSGLREMQRVDRGAGGGQHIDQQAFGDEAAAVLASELTLSDAPGVLAGEQRQLDHDDGVIVLSQMGQNAVEVLFKLSMCDAPQQVVPSQFDDDKSGEVVGLRDLLQAIRSGGPGLREIGDRDVVAIL